MGFHEFAVYPIKLSYGSTFGPGFNAAIVEGTGGRSQRIPRLEQPLYAGDLATGIRSLTELATFRTFYMARQGAAYGFRFQDPLDNTSASDGVSDPTGDDQEIGIGDGTTTTFQLRKQYSDALITRNRTIEKPVDGTVVVKVDGVSSPFTLFSTIGYVRMDEPPEEGQVVTAGFEFHVPVRFTKDVDEGLRVNVAAFDSGSLAPIGVIEDRNSDSLEDEFFYGGAIQYDLDAGESVALSIAGGRVVSLNPADTTSTVYLPATDGLPGGGPYFYVRNVSAFSIVLAKNDGNVLTTLGPGSQVTLLLMDTGPYEGWWYF